jgi:hypothetical protein
VSHGVTSRDMPAAAALATGTAAAPAAAGMPCAADGLLAMAPAAGRRRVAEGWCCGHPLGVAGVTSPLHPTVRCWYGRLLLLQANCCCPRPSLLPPGAAPFLQRQLPGAHVIHPVAEVHEAAGHGQLQQLLQHRLRQAGMVVVLRT